MSEANKQDPSVNNQTNTDVATTTAGTFVEDTSSENTATEETEDPSVDSDTENTTTEATENTETSNVDPVPVNDADADVVYIKQVGNVVFKKSNLILLSWFLVVYILAYFVLGMFFGSSAVSNFQANVGRLIDFMFLCGFLLYVFTYYYYVPESKFKEDVQSTYEDTIAYLNNSMSLLTTTLFIITFYTIVYLFRIPMSYDAKPIFISLIENTAWIGLLLVSIISFFKHVLGVPMDDLFDKLNPFSKKEEPEESEIVIEEDEVFNVSNNLYTYEDAQAVCSAFGAKIANYDQIENAYNNGAEWCSYGWSEDQMAYFPTQKSTWDKLQKKPKHKNNCGRPGVNGGYIANPYVKFGVNCYGKKPKATDADIDRLNAKQNQVFPKSKKDKELDEKVKHWKENADKLLQINSYNNNQWSRY